MQLMKARLAWCVVVVVVAALVSADAMAGNRKLMTVNAAKVVAERAILESITGLKIRAEERVDEMIAGGVTVEAKTEAAVKGIEYTDIVYDPDKDIARVTASIDLGTVTNIVGKDIDFGGRRIQRVGFATSTPAMAAPLQAMRAAEIDAYKNLAKKIVGFTLQSNTRVEDFVMRSDRIRTRLLAAIYGAELTSYRWDEEGDAYVTMSIRIGEIDDVLGQKVIYDGDVLEVEGAGAQYDELSGSPGTFSTRGASTTVREGTLDVPVGGPAPRVDENTGGGVSLQ